MQIEIHYGFEQKKLGRPNPRSYRESYTTYFVVGRTAVSVREVRRDDVLPAATVDLRKVGRDELHDVKAEDGRAEFLWHGGSFWVGQERADSLPVRAGDDYRGGAFRAVASHHRSLGGTDQKYPSVLVEHFEPAKVKDKVNQARAKAAESAARCIVVEGRFYERCPEPVACLRRDGHVLGVGFAPRGGEEDIAFAGVSVFEDRGEAYGRACALQRLAEAGVEGVEVHAPEVFVADLRRGKTMGHFRREVGELLTEASRLPRRHLMATKRLRDALADAWTSPTEDLVRMCEEFVELGPVTEDEFAVLRESFARMRKGDAEMTKLKSAVAWATDSIHERLPKMREELADRIHPDLPRQRSLLKGWDCVVARAETPDEVFRCARLAGVDPVRLLEDFRDGTRDVLVAHAGDNRRADSAWQRFFDPNLVAGTRIVDADETAVHGFAPSAEPGLRSALAALDYPPLEVVSRRVAP